MKKFSVEITDTFGGEANYSWVTRLEIEAKSELGAIRKVGNNTGLRWHKVMDGYGCYASRYDSKSGATCCFIEEIFSEVE